MQDSPSRIDEDTGFGQLFQASSSDLAWEAQDLVSLLLEPDLSSDPMKQEALDTNGVLPLVLPELPSVQQEVQPPVRASAVAASTHTTITPHPEDSHFDDDEEEEEAESQRGGPKRRRRIRNAKQQELNRLAQQRYRERKKKRHQDLQVTVDTLATQLSELKAKDEVIADLKKSKAQLEQTVLAQQAVLHQARDTLTLQARTIADQERALIEHKAVIEKQRQQQQLLAGSAQLDPNILTEQLGNILKDAFTEMGANVSSAAAQLLQDKLLAAVSRLGSCWRDVRPSALPKTPAEPQPSAITVSCC